VQLFHVLEQLLLKLFNLAFPHLVKFTPLCYRSVFNTMSYEENLIKLYIFLQSGVEDLNISQN